MTRAEYRSLLFQEDKRYQSSSTEAGMAYNGSGTDHGYREIKIAALFS
jgi:hypothetical protein